MRLSAIIFLSFALSLTACAQRGNSGGTPSSLKSLSQTERAKLSVATFAAGCFWHEEGLFETIKGVKDVESGYAGGTAANPSYEKVETGNTGHAETVNVYYDPKETSFADLLKVYFAGADPTQVNGQGNDIGTQYRSIVFYRTPAEKAAIDAAIAAVKAQYKKPIAVQVMPFSKFWTAEGYHQNYIPAHTGEGYVQYCIREIRETQNKLPAMVKPGFKY